jgi:hypothetical protein
MESPSQNPQVISPQHQQTSSAQNIMEEVRQAQALQAEREAKEIGEMITMQSNLAGLRQYNQNRQREYITTGLTFGLGGFLVGIVLFGLGGKDK